MSCHQLGTGPCHEAQPVTLSVFTADSQIVHQLKQDLSEQLDAQHAILLRELQSLHALFNRVQEELQTVQTLRHSNVSAKADSHDLENDSSHQLPQPNVSTPTMLQGDSVSISSGNDQWPQAADEEMPRPTPMLKSLSRTSTKEHLSNLDNHPALKAFLQAKNWEPESFDVDPDDALSKALETEEMAKDNCLLRAKLRQLVEASWFDLFVGMAILLNALIMSLNLEYDGLQTADTMQIDGDSGDWPAAEASFTVFRHIFTLFFLSELIAKLIVYGCRFFKQFWNWLDFIIVAWAVLETYVFSMINVSSPNMSFMRLLRMGKIVKVLRIVRVLRVFTQLRVLLVAISCSLPALGWSMALLAVVQLIASIFMTQSLQGWLQDENNDQETREFVYEYFGSFSRSSLSMFEMTLAPGTWSRFGRVIIYKVSRWYMIFFFGYATFISFAVIRVISAIFLKETLNAAARDGETVMAELNRNPEFVRGIKKVFEETDLDKSGHISLDELDGLLENEQSEAFLGVMGISANEVSGLFRIMDDGDDQITFAEFLAGVMRLKAHGGIDLVTLLYENKRILAKIVNVEQHMLAVLPRTRDSD